MCVSGTLALINPHTDLYTVLMYLATSMAVVLWFSIMLLPLVQVQEIFKYLLSLAEALSRGCGLIGSCTFHPCHCLCLTPQWGTPPPPQHGMSLGEVSRVRGGRGLCTDERYLFVS